ncbi:hypothetical protein [Paraglaciecola hydrolytica]|uniref:Peptidase M15A C-terminal domain-containing protein n=1 Tax=Paraglaciecola hydrolytica TaxID=1799789 RepID=A0A136A306_9ALTE|nr:hypothetical protein [Paraglaciecola hydrolytica]KXI29587.1 hypothetical protein AX660_05905 [Paraglaciecola hydrolytica]
MVLSPIDKLVEQVVNWHFLRYPQIKANTPSDSSLAAISLLCEHVLLPIQKKFGQLDITYGFTSSVLLKEILKKAPQGIAPKLDQHASHEVNSKRNPHCQRYGAACDFMIAGYKNDMDQVADWISQNVGFDRLYFYGTNRPIHISVGPDNSRFIQIMSASQLGKRIPKKSGSGVPFSNLWNND